jgi:hypothetical protein
MTERIPWPYKYVEEGNREVLCAQVRECASLFCRVGETARILGCTPQAFAAALKADADVFDSWEDGIANASMSLRQTQLELAKKAPGMAIFLGKNYLGQVDEPKVRDRDDNALKRQLEALPPEALLQIQKILQDNLNKEPIPAKPVVLLGA